MKTFFLIFTFFLLSKNICAQQLDRQVFSSCGLSIKTGTIWLDYTIGEMAVVSYTAGSLVLNQGFQQVYNTTISISNISPSAAIKVYPNPGSAYLQIDVPEEIVNKSFYRITDITGKVISEIDYKNTLLSSGNTVLNIEGFPVGIYLLSVLIPETGNTYIFRLIKV